MTTARYVAIERPQADWDNDLAQTGHWEGDLNTGTANRSAIGTLVERTTRYPLLVNLPDQRTAEATNKGVVASMSALPAVPRRTLTWDQGKEMAAHHQPFRAQPRAASHGCRTS